MIEYTNEYTKQEAIVPPEGSAGDSSSNNKNSSKPLSLEGIKDKMDFLNFLVYAIVVVLLLGFLGMIFALGAILQSQMVSKQATYEDLRDKINILVEESKTKVEDEKTLKINALEQEIKGLKAKNPYLK